MKTLLRKLWAWVLVRDVNTVRTHLNAYAVNKLLDPTL